MNSRLLLVIALFAYTAFAVTNTTMSSYYAVGSTSYDLGVSIGSQQKEAFKELRDKTDLDKKLIPWMNEHMDQFKAFCDANKAAYPEIYSELQGIAKGAEMDENEALLLALSPEILTLWNAEHHETNTEDNCFDILYNPKENEGDAFIAHNEDWTPDYKRYAFVLHENLPFSNGATHITALTYPAYLVGFTFGYNDKGVVTSCNGLFPKTCRPGKLGRYFINRDVLGATSAEDAIDRLKKAAKDSSLGFAMSIGVVGSHELYHAEMAPYNPQSEEEGGVVDIIKIEPGQTYLHSNTYEHAFFTTPKKIEQDTSNSTTARLARAREMDDPRSPELALKILGDETNPIYPIYRYGSAIDPDELATVSTAVMNLDNATIIIYGGNPTLYDPVVVMPLFKPPPAPFNVYNSTPFIAMMSVAGTLCVALIVVAGVAYVKFQEHSH